MPRKRRVPAPTDFLAGTCAAALVFLAAFVPVLALADPARDVLVGTASALEATSKTGDASSSFPLAEPLRWIPYLAGRALGPWADPVATVVRDLASGGDLASACLAVSLLGAVCAGLTATLFRMRHHRKRIKMMEGRLKQW